MSDRPTRRWKRKLLAGVGLLAGTILVAPSLLGRRTIDPGVEATALPEHGFAYDDLAAALAWAGPEGVDYERLVADSTDLRRFTATIAATGPRTEPDRFPNREDRLAYYINAYNALTLLGVVEAWPIATIHDVRGLIEPKPGFGFFYGQRFGLDGRKVNLYDLENETIRPFGDARIHAAINCASTSCPSLVGTPYLPETLDAQLEAAARGFVGDPRHVAIGDDGRSLVLSSIFQWFGGDFEDHSAALGGERDTIAWIVRHAPPDRAEAIATVRDSEPTVTYAGYDWSLNDAL